ncbi:MAG: hypothetical protein PHU05_02105 [Bacilli bacterium]|nr:hypothetical protein [Bacilli bacterium]
MYLNFGKEEDLLRFKNVLYFLFIISFLISIFITYDKKLKLEKKPSFLSIEESSELIKSNRYFFLLLLLGFFYINYQNKNLNPEKNTICNNIEIVSSLLNVLFIIIIILNDSKV